MFVDKRTGLLKLIVSERVVVEVMGLAGGLTPKVQDMVNRLNKQCVSLDDEVSTLMRLNGRKHGKKHHQKRRKQQRTNKSPSKKKHSMWFLNSRASCQLPYVRHEKNCALSASTPLSPQQATRTAEQKICIFLHGSGETLVQPPSNSRADYWGNIHQFTPQCSERWFIAMDTKNYGWDDLELQKRYCELAAYHNAPGHPVVTDSSPPALISNTIIFAHSMGNLIFASSLKNGYCAMGHNSSWYSVASPYDGSAASIMLKDLCYHYYHGMSPSFIKKISAYVAQVAGYCVPNSPNAYQSYISLDPNYCSPDGKQCITDLAPIVQSQLSGASCGLSPYGLTSKYSVMLGVLSSVVGYGQSNDGMVAESSCELTHAHEFVDDVSANFYSTTCNHADATCRNGNGWWSDRRQPCSYYTNKL